MNYPDSVLKNAHERIKNIREKKKKLFSEQKEFIKVLQDDEKEFEQQAIATILSHGDSIGAVVVLCKEKGNNSDEALLQVVKTAAGFLGKHMEQ